jgi:outer membrane receptor for ferrienterochelin and colicins
MLHHDSRLPKRAWATAVCFVSLALPLVAQGPAPTAVKHGCVEGAVADATGLPVRGARIVLRNSLNGEAKSALSDDLGRYSITGVRPGNYVASASARDFSEQSRSLDLTNDDAAQNISFQLEVGGRHESVTVVSGSRVEEIQSLSPVKVDVVTKQQILDTGYERVSDLLAEVPGVVVRRTSSGSVAGEQIDGIDSRQVLLLQDGLPIVGARGVKSGVINLNRQSTMRLDQVEVVKGAASTMFGSEAIGGVINQITRDPVSPLEINASVAGGSLGEVDGDLGIGGKYKRLSFLAEIERHRQDSYSLIPGSYATVGPEYVRNNGFGKLRYALSPNATLSFTADAYHNREEGKTSSATGPTSNISNDSTQSYALLGDFILPANTMLQARAYSARYDENSMTLGSLVGSVPSALANLNERYHRLDATLGRTLFGRQFVQGGVEWAQDNTGQQVTATDYWLQDRVQITSRLLATIGGRITQHSLYGTYTVPKAGVVYCLTDRLSLRGSFGKGFRAPDLGQLYYRFANPASYYQVIGNPNLQPENSRSFSAGADYAWQRVRLGLNLFRNDLNHLIDSRSVGTPTTAESLAAILIQYNIPSNFQPLVGRLTYIYFNVNRAFTEGASANIEVKPFRDLLLRGSYSYLQAKDQVTLLALTQRSPHQGFFQASYSERRSKLNLNVRGSFLSSWLLDAAARTRAFGYGIWDVYASRELAKGLSLYASIDNIGNDRDPKLALATPTFDRADYGRTWRTGLRYRFGRESR